LYVGDFLHSFYICSTCFRSVSQGAAENAEKGEIFEKFIRDLRKSFPGKTSDPKCMKSLNKVMFLRSNDGGLILDPNWKFCGEEFDYFENQLNWKACKGKNFQSAIIDTKRKQICV